MKQMSLPIPELPIEEENDQELLDAEFEEVLDDDERQIYIDFKKEKKDDKNSNSGISRPHSKQLYHSRVPLFL